MSEHDDERFVDTTRTLYENASEPKRLEVLSGDAHAQRLFETEHGTNLEQWIDDLIGTVCNKE